MSDEDQQRQRLLEMVEELLPEEIRAAVQQLSAMNQGRRVVLYLDPTMMLGGNFVPVMNVEGDSGYYRFPRTPVDVRRIAAHFFGDNYAQAKRAVDATNQVLGVDPQEALEIVIATMFGSGTR